MKRLIATGLVLVMAGGLLAGCQRSNIATNFGQAVIEWKENEGKKQSETVIDTYQDGDMGESLGFDIVMYPDSAAMPADKFFAIDNWFAQIQYKMPDGRDLVVRVAREDTRTLIYSYNERHETDLVTKILSGAEVAVGLSEKGCTLASWNKGGFQYLVHSNERQAPPSDGEIEALVSGLLCRDVEDESS